MPIVVLRNGIRNNITSSVSVSRKTFKYIETYINSYFLKSLINNFKQNLNLTMPNMAIMNAIRNITSVQDLFSRGPSSSSSSSYTGIQSINQSIRNTTSVQDLFSRGPSSSSSSSYTEVYNHEWYKEYDICTGSVFKRTFQFILFILYRYTIIIQDYTEL